MRDVLIVIVNYKVGALCVQALDSIADQVDPGSGNRVVVVDNASGDGSDDEIECAIETNGWSVWAELVRSPVNGGFAAGNNFGIEHARASGWSPAFVHLLNPDVVARPDALRILWEFMETHPEVGIGGSRLDDEDGTQHHSRYRFPSLMSEIEARLGLGFVTRWLRHSIVAMPLGPETEQVDWLAGASMMIRRAVLDEIGSLDDGYFMYFEEVDFCLRARRAGWPCWYVAESRVSHLAGMSSGIDMASTAVRRLPPYWFRSRRRFWVRNHGYLYALFIDGVAILCDLFRRLRIAVQRKPDTQPEGFVLDLMRVGLSRGERLPLPGTGG